MGCRREIAMPDVLLGQAYYLRFDPKLWQAQQPYPPLGTLYAASYLRQRGRSVALFDAMLAESVGEWAQALARERPRVAVIYEDSFNYLSKMCLLRMRDAALAMIELAREAGCPVVVSGSDATDHPDLYLARGAAAVILGEGEITLADVVERLLSGRPLADVAGIAYLDASGAVCRSPARPFIRSLDDLPFPAWDLVDVDRYRAIWRSRHGYHSMNLATTRGVRITATGARSRSTASATRCAVRQRSSRKWPGSSSTSRPITSGSSTTCSGSSRDGWKSLRA